MTATRCCSSHCERLGHRVHGAAGGLTAEDIRGKESRARSRAVQRRGASDQQRRDRRAVPRRHRPVGAAVRVNGEPANTS